MISAIEDKIKVEIKSLLLFFNSKKYCSLFFCRYNTELFDVNGALLHVTEELLAYSITPTFMSYVAQLCYLQILQRDSTDIQYLLQYFKDVFSCMSFMTQSLSPAFHYAYNTNHALLPNMVISTCLI